MKKALPEDETEKDDKKFIGDKLYYEKENTE